MSYILNALRKSERERQAKQASTPAAQVLQAPQQPNRKKMWLIGGILVVNLLAIALVVWYLSPSDPTPAKPKPAAPLAAPKTPRPSPRAAAPVVVEAPQADERAPKTPAPARKNQKISPPGMLSPRAASIEDLARARQAPAPDEQPSESAKRREQEIQAKQARRVLNAEVDAPDDPDAVETEAVTEQKPRAAAAQAEIPFLQELPYEFRSTVPALAINVFKYDNNPEERFVIVNMAKYKAGKTTKDGVEITEIRADSVVARYGGRTFRIPRP